MATMNEAAKDFLAQKKIAVVGVSRDTKRAANFIYKKLRSLGYSIFAVNPIRQRLKEMFAIPILNQFP
jgi:predicted CoA-binding protein